MPVWKGSLWWIRMSRDCIPAKCGRGVIITTNHPIPVAKEIAMASLYGSLYRIWERLCRPFLATLAALVIQFGTLGCVHLPSFAEGLLADVKGSEEEGQGEVQPAVQSAPPTPILPMEPQEKPPAKGKRWEWSGDKRQVTHIWVDTDTQKARFYDGPEQVGWSYVASGIKTYPTPAGKFSVIGKEKTKESNLYGKIYDSEGKVVVSDAKRGRHKIPPGGRFAGAKMPYFLRLTSDGVGLHAGPIPRPGHPASHGCIRLPAPLAERLFTQVGLGTQVTITGSGPDYGDYQAKLAAQGPSRQEPAEGGFVKPAEGVQTYPAKLALPPPVAKASAAVGATSPGSAKPAVSEAVSSTNLPSPTSVKPSPVEQRVITPSSAAVPGSASTPTSAPQATPAAALHHTTAPAPASVSDPAPAQAPAPTTAPAPAPAFTPVQAPVPTQAPAPASASAQGLASTSTSARVPAPVTQVTAATPASSSPLHPALLPSAKSKGGEDSIAKVVVPPQVHRPATGESLVREGRLDVPVSMPNRIPTVE